jgi:hypothetical protein
MNGTKGRQRRSTDRDPCDAKPPHNGFPAESLVKDFAGQSYRERFVHYTCVWKQKQVLTPRAFEALPIMNLLGSRTLNTLTGVQIGTYPGAVHRPGGIAYGHSLEREPIWWDTDDCSADFRDWPYPSPGELP